MISAEERQMAIKLITEARVAGAGQARACEIMGIASRTLRRWQRQQEVQEQRKKSGESCARQ